MIVVRARPRFGNKLKCISKAMKTVYAFGEPVPEEFLAGLLADGWSDEELTTENLETYLEYDRRDEE